MIRKPGAADRYGFLGEDTDARVRHDQSARNDVEMVVRYLAAIIQVPSRDADDRPRNRLLDRRPGAPAKPRVTVTSRLPDADRRLLRRIAARSSRPGHQGPRMRARALDRLGRLGRPLRSLGFPIGEPRHFSRKSAVSAGFFLNFRSAHR